MTTHHFCHRREPHPYNPEDDRPRTEQLLDNPGYHLVAIRKGELGELSKIREELEELADAMAQGSRVMAAVELSDMLGAIQAFIAKHLPGMTLEDFVKFSNITKRAFENGRRTAN